ncbi:MAG: 16S rRNA (adenine(1518)-N(6)/adenine(1519)-N(6))-dimethyltransferase [Nitratiruptor sp.]|nr:16S rRNA (adenine(1518)-N(6)/adenine(1519)-N(6))-dimethyltransferase [Nitratiruptor sp.]NPA82956.1 16S rRNA (adenine(1518)-N(6)/adenine(1519)-N(6))-dimethyltransferase RsmA [Campylobacterota bacterium]
MIVAKKRFGQNFLKDRAVLDRIIQSMPKSDRKIVEIGPGLGDLTQRLLEHKDVIAFEIDRDLCAHLRRRFAQEIESGRLELVCGDVLEQWHSGSLIDEPYDLVANLPYYVATNIVLKALGDPNCHNILVMLQKEVAQKFAAHPGEREFSSLGVLAQSVGKVAKLFIVKPTSFHPAPKVDSAVLLIAKERNLDDPAFMDFLKVAFAQPRKRLMKNLAVGYGKERIQSIFADLGLQETLRPHEATTSIYHQIHARLKETIDGDQREQEHSDPDPKS